MQITNLLQRLHGGDGDVMHELIPLVYDELKRLARSHVRREVGPPRQTATGLVHETFLKLAGGRHPLYENRAHFYGIASRLMRQILVDTARARSAAKRGFGMQVALDDATDCPAGADTSVLAMEDALRGLEKTDPLKVRLIEMRFFGGLTAEESSAALAIPVHVIRREMRLARAWLRRELAGAPC
jgi:RNA polymerase sigma factor (TIGR02999 family)